jgi:hypothetical protein
MPSDDKTQNSFLYAILAFCMTAIFFEILFAVIKGGFVWGLWQFILIFVLSSIAAVGGFIAGKMLG